MEALLPSSISPKISTILQSHVYPRFGRVLRALARVKSALLDAALGRTKWGLQRRRRKQHTTIGCGCGCGSSKKKRTSRQQAATNFGSIVKRPPHLTWSGGGLSPARAAAEAALDVNHHVYPCYSSWNAVVVPGAALGGIDGGMAAAASEYCGYLRWLEEEMPDEVVVVEEDDEGEEDADAGGGGNEIDRLAEQFIARCRAKFLLEKQESYDRRCQEMIARSL